MNIQSENQKKVKKSEEKTSNGVQPDVSGEVHNVKNITEEPKEFENSHTPKLRTLYNGIDLQGFSQKELDYEQELYRQEKNKYTGKGKTFLHTLPENHPLIQVIKPKWLHLVNQWDKFRIPVGGNKRTDSQIINDFKQLRESNLNRILMVLNDGSEVLCDFSNRDCGLNQFFPEMLNVPTTNGSVIDGLKDFRRFLYGYESKILNHPKTIVHEGNISSIFKEMCRLTLGTTPVGNFPSMVGMFIIMESYFETLMRYRCIPNDNFMIHSPCSGWGGRLLSVLSVFNRMREDYRMRFGRQLHLTYLGTDPNKSVDERFNNIILDWFEHIESPNTRQYFHFHKETLGCETPEFLDYCKSILKLYGNSGVNVSLTSPPYFNREKYSKDPSQSYLKYPTYSEWRIKFLKGMIDNVHELLIPGGNFYLNISNTYEPNGVVYPMESDTVTFFQECGMKPVTTYKMLLQGSSQSVNYIGDGIDHKFEPVFVFEK